MSWWVEEAVLVPRGGRGQRKEDASGSEPTGSKLSLALEWRHCEKSTFFCPGPCDVATEALKGMPMLRGFFFLAALRLTPIESKRERERQCLPPWGE